MNPLWTAAKEQAMIKTRRVERKMAGTFLNGWLKDVERVSRCVIPNVRTNGVWNWQIWLENLHQLDVHLYVMYVLLKRRDFHLCSVTGGGG